MTQARCRIGALKIALMLLVLLAASPVFAQDARRAAQQAEQDRKEALEKAQEVEARILADREKLTAEVERLETEQRELEQAVARLEKEIEQNENRREKLMEKWGHMELDFQEISGNVRVVARDLETMLLQSPITALYPERLQRIQPMLNKGYFPDIDDIAALADIFFDEINRSGQVGWTEGNFVGRDGNATVGKILTLGKFTSIYREGDEVGFLRHSPESQRLFALSALPSGKIRGQLRKYTEGESDVVPIDISGGAALRTITHQTSIMDQLRSGGPIVWPIGLIALVALLIVLNRLVFLNRVQRNTGKYMTQVNELASQGKWDECEEIVKHNKGEHSPVNHVIEAGLQARHEDRETLESILQEAILREMPRVERGLSVLAVLGAIAPLLGLLGTVTGMIDTFRVITLFGTGDPKLMSGGISEALVTTELGLAIAIPIMLLHTLLSRRSGKIIGDMEEKAVSLINIIERGRARIGIA